MDCGMLAAGAKVAVMRVPLACTKAKKIGSKSMTARSLNFTRHLWWFGLSVAVVACMVGATCELTAQESVGKMPAKASGPLPPDPEVHVAVGSSYVLPFDPVIEGVDMVDRTVCNVRQIRRGMIVQGLKFGKTRVTIWGE